MDTAVIILCSVMILSCILNIGVLVYEKKRTAVIGWVCCLLWVVNYLLMFLSK